MRYSSNGQIGLVSAFEAHVLTEVKSTVRRYSGTIRIGL
jgi:hypothetical protein